MLYDGDTFKHSGHKFRVRFPHDDDAGTPWEAADGHGPVSEWTSRAKRPGEWVLCSDRGRKRFYDAQEAQRIARNDRWDAAPYNDGKETRGMQAAKAVKADFEFLHGWCNDHWHYVGVVVTLLDDDGDAMDESASLWGVESIADDHLEETARELADEIVAGLLETLCA